LGRPGAAAGEKTLAEQLGYRKDERLLMIHADDIGMCHSVNVASSKALTEGIASSGSVMVPCPWFPEIAAWSKEHPKVDLGLHLTLTSEWKYYRWRPLSPPEKVRGLLDPEGFMWRSELDVKKHARPEEVELEIRAQIQRALDFGMKPTHVDSHMGTLFADAGFFEVYTRVAKETGFMPMLPAPSPEINAQAALLGLDYPAVSGKLRSSGFMLLDRLVLELEGKDLDSRREGFRKFVRGLTPGVTELIVHLSGDEDEIRNVTGNWGRRYWEFRILTDPESRKFLEDEKVKLVGYRELAPAWKR
jgi:predicted glycoside hydrolase/deacetylase ChbG (UPF0249 family)